MHQIIRGTIATLGETITLVLKSDDGTTIEVTMPTDALTDALPLLMALVMRAREREDAGLPAEQVTGERIVARAAKVVGLAVHHADRGGVVLEFSLAPTGLPFAVSLPPEGVDQLRTRLPQTKPPA